MKIVINQLIIILEIKKKRLFCSEHKENGMIDIIHVKTLCLYPDCDKQSSYNYENEILHIHCSEHKKDGMVDVRGKKCIYKNSCVHKPSFNFKNEEALHCSKHKLDSIVNIYLDFYLEIGCNVYL